MNPAFIFSVAFLSLTLVCIILLLLLIGQTGFARLESVVGIERDGLPIGKVIPPWSLPDLMGRTRKTPATTHWQFLVFVDYALAGFPDLIVGMHDLASAFEEIEVLVLSRSGKDVCEAMVRGLHLQVPVVPVDQHFYDRYRVRIMPFGFLLDPQGVVQWVGLINSKELLFHIWRLSQAKSKQNRLAEEVKQ